MSTLESLAVLQNCKPRVPVGPSIFTTKYILKKIESISRHKICAQMFISSIIHSSPNIKKKTRMSMNDEWINKT